MLSTIIILVCIAASTVGAVSGIGGGVLIKPILELMNTFSHQQLSLISTLTVFSMSTFAILLNFIKKENLVKFEKIIFLSLGSAFGGFGGKYIVDILKKSLSSTSTISTIQSIALALLTLGSLIFIIKKKSIKTYKLKNQKISFLIGFSLGVISSFLSIGGGPINLVILFFFFSFDAKTAAQSSLFVIFFSQISSLSYTFVFSSFPKLDLIYLIGMPASGILGAIIGSKLSRKFKNSQIKNLLVASLAFIIIISLIIAFR